MRKSTKKTTKIIYVTLPDEGIRPIGRTRARKKDQVP